MKCPECGHEIKEGVTRCDHCESVVEGSFGDDAFSGIADPQFALLDDSDLPDIAESQVPLLESILIKPVFQGFRASGEEIQQGILPLANRATVESDPYTVLLTFGSEGQREGELSQPFMLALKPDGGIYVLDRVAGNQTRMQEFSPQGQFIRVIETFALGDADGDLDGPTGVAVDRSGSISILEANNNRVQKFDSNGTWLATFGKEGVDSGELSFPRGLDCGGDGSLYIADTDNHRIQKWDSTGRCVSIIGQNKLDADLGEYTESDAPGEFDCPQGVAVDATGNLFVADTQNHRIQQFDSQGRYVTSFGKPGKAPGQIHFPISIQTLTDGSLFVSDLNGNRCQKFTRTGDLVYSVALNAAETGASIGHILVDSAEKIIVAMRQEHQIAVIRSLKA